MEEHKEECKKIEDICELDKFYYGETRFTCGTARSLIFQYGNNCGSVTSSPFFQNLSFRSDISQEYLKSLDFYYLREAHEDEIKIFTDWLESIERCKENPVTAQDVLNTFISEFEKAGILTNSNE
jgi:hypothetical protein